MDDHELSYLFGRATAEFQSAQRAPSIVSARPHYRMAVEYLERAEALNRRLRSNGTVQQRHCRF